MRCSVASARWRSCRSCCRGASRTAGRIAVYPYLRHEAVDRSLGLQLLHGRKPRADLNEDVLDAAKSLNEPPEVVRFAVALDLAAEDPLKLEQHLGWSAREAMLGRGNANAMPVGGVSTGSSMWQTEVTFAIEKASSPGEIAFAR